MLAALSSGLAKTGLPGFGILAVPLMAQAMPAKSSTGVLLLVLICADLLAVFTYRKGADWAQVARLLGWALPGIALGTATMKYLDPHTMQRLIGGILIVMVGLALRRRLRKTSPETEESLPSWVAPVAGIVAGFTTMVANAAGPVMILYLLAMRLPKEVFLPTSAWFFFCINWIKVPFGIYSGIVTIASAKLSVVLFLPAILGGLLGRVIAKKLDQRVFETLAWILTVAAALKMLFL